MRPTREQIEVAAYRRWQRRGEIHGGNQDDWVAAEKDLTFGLNYRYIARHRLDGPAVLLGKAEAEAAGHRRRCRFCEQGEPATPFSEPLALPQVLGNTALRAWDECDDCRASSDSALTGSFGSFARPMLGPSPALPPAEIPAAALKELVRIALSVLPPAELPHFGDTIEWVSNPDHARDASLLVNLGCHVYLTPSPVPAPFIALARRVDDDGPWPYLLAFLATSRVVFETHLPLCTRDEDLEDVVDLRGPELSMSLGTGPWHLASFCAYLPVSRPAIRSSRTGYATASGSGRG